MTDETRQLRRRLDALGSAIDRRSPTASTAAQRRLVQVYDGGAMGSAPNLFYLANPVELDGREVEGGAATPSADTTQTLAVVFLNQAPNVGDYAVATLVGGRWVADSGASGVGACCVTGCSPCSIPTKNLTIAWTNSLEGDGSDTLVYNGNVAGVWQTGCSGGAGIGNQLEFALLCDNGQVELRVTYFLSGECPTGQSNYCSNLRTEGFRLLEGSYTCSPFSMTFTDTSASCPSIASSGFTSFTVSDPDPIEPPVMCQLFTIQYCSGDAGGTVSVYRSDGGALVASGAFPTPGNPLGEGSVYLTWQGSDGAYYVVATDPNGNVIFSNTVNLKCGGVIVLPANYNFPYPACCGTCPIDLGGLYGGITNLTLTDANGSYPVYGIRDYDTGVVSWYTNLICAPSPNVATPTVVYPNCQFTLGEGDVSYNYYMNCVEVDGESQWSVVRIWQYYGCEVSGCEIGGPTCVSPFPDGTFYFASCVGTCGRCVGGGDSPECCYPNQDSSFLTAPFEQCDPVIWSGVLAGSSSPLGDPVGGTVVIEASS